jgi:hypothetical protein
MYNESDEQKMKCLDIALEYAMKASSEIEHRTHPVNSAEQASAEKDALERVRRISSEKSILSDKTQVNEILLLSKYGDADHFRAAKGMIDDLTSRLNGDLWKRADAAPDKFVELFLTESSAIAAKHVSEWTIRLLWTTCDTWQQLFIELVKKSLEQYSHVHTGALCGKLARRWLVHGDSSSGSHDVEPTKAKTRPASAQFR